MSIIRSCAKVLTASCLAATLVCAPALAAQQLNRSQVIQFLTSKKQQTTDGRTSVWKANGTYQISGRNGWLSGSYSVDNSGRVCWRGQSGASGCFVVLKEGNTYFQRSNRGTVQYR